MHALHIFLAMVTNPGESRVDCHSRATSLKVSTERLTGVGFYAHSKSLPCGNRLPDLGHPIPLVNVPCPCGDPLHFLVHWFDTAAPSGAISTMMQSVPDARPLCPFSLSAAPHEHNPATSDTTGCCQWEREVAGYGIVMPRRDRMGTVEWAWRKGCPKCGATTLRKDSFSTGAPMARRETQVHFTCMKCGHSEGGGV